MFLECIGARFAFVHNRKFTSEIACIGNLVLVPFAGSQLFSMLANKVIFVLLLAACGTSGCATIERWYALPVTIQNRVSPAPPVANDLSTPAISSPASTPATVAIVDPPIPVETGPAPAGKERAPALRSAPAASRALPEPKSERTEIREQAATTTNKPPPIAGATPAPSTLRADNRLLELLERDFDQAVEQPAEPRRLQFSKEIVTNPKVRHFVRYYSTTAKGHFQRMLERSGKYMPMIAKVLKQEGLPEDLGYLALLESEFIVNTTSPSGAVGLWQFVAGTARKYALRIDEWVDERRDPVKSTRAAAAYLKDLHEHYGRWYLATAAYNAGAGTISKAMKSSGAKDFWSLSQKARLSEETRNFVPKFVAIALIAKDPGKYGFNPIEYAAALDYEEVELPWSMKLETVAEMAESDAAAVRELNPALLRNTTPPGEGGFRVNLPVGKSAAYLARVDEKSKEKEAEAVQMVTHEVRKGETLFAIARHYGQEVRALMEFNGLTTARLRIGQKLRILLEGIRALR
jgi:soluble lytic murein transglycosylase-like protein/LysM repeat protein